MLIRDKEMFGRYLKKHRVAAGMSQQELRAALGYKTPQYVSNWERGVCGPPFEQLGEICHLLKIDRTELFEMLMKDTREYLTEDLGFGKGRARKGRRH